MVNAGPIESCSFGGRSFAVAEDSDPGRDLGGFTNATEMNGDGTARNIQTRKPWKISGIGLQIDDDRLDHEFLQDKADGGAEENFSITYNDGNVYYGKGQLVGDIAKSPKNAIMEVEFSGPQKLTQQ